MKKTGIEILDFKISNRFIKAVKKIGKADILYDESSRAAAFNTATYWNLLIACRVYKDIINGVYNFLGADPVKKTVLKLLNKYTLEEITILINAI
jgi:hypothetical protein